MPKYEAFLQTHVPLGGGDGDFNKDVKMMSKKIEGRVMKEESQVALGEFYLAVAMQLRPAEIEAAGSDNTALGHASGQQHTLDRAHTAPKATEQAVAAAEKGLTSGDSSMEPARRAGELVYSKWLQASSMPVKAVIANSLMEHGLMVSIDVYQSDKLLPDYLNAPQ